MGFEHKKPEPAPGELSPKNREDLRKTLEETGVVPIDPGELPPLPLSPHAWRVAYEAPEHREPLPLHDPEAALAELERVVNEIAKKQNDPQRES